MTTRADLIAQCKEKGLKGYSGKKKEDLLALLSAQAATIEHVPAPAATKKTRGQFYTTNNTYILSGLPGPPADARCVLEPFAGKGDLLEWLASATGYTGPVEAYDIEPKRADIVKRDTLLSPPDYTDAWVLTNPPYLARNKCTAKEVFDLYNMNDLYKCFLMSLGDCARGGILLIPAGFFFSPRDIDVRCRDTFLSAYRLIRVKYFEEQVFDDTTTTIVAIAFERRPVGVAPYTEQAVEWVRYPAGESRVFHIRKADDWIIGGEVYRLPPSLGPAVSVRRHVEGVPLRAGEHQTHLTLNALDSGVAGGEIALEYRLGYIYPAKECSRTFATLRISGRGPLSEAEQRTLAADFNALLGAKRAELWSLFLPQYRESKEYARKRIPFELAYTIVLHLLKATDGT